MRQSSEKIRYILQYHFDQGDSASQAFEKKNCGDYGESASSNTTAQQWFVRFCFETSMLMTLRALVDQSLKNLVKFFKTLRKTGTFHLMTTLQN